MRDENGRLIRFVGVLREDYRFIHVPAWETARTTYQPEEGDGTYLVALLDADGRVLVRVSPKVEFRPPEDPEAGGLRLADILVYVPWHPEARVLAFRRQLPDELEIFRAELAPRPPAVHDLVLEGRPPGELRLTWAAEHDHPLSFAVFYWPEGRPPLILASGLRDTSLTLATEKLPGPMGRFVVAASDGLRSNTVLSEPVEGFPTSLRVRIVAPLGGSVLPPDQPVDLIGRAEDPAGMPAEVDELIWSIDGETKAQGGVAAITLEPGEHQIELTGLREGEEVARDVVSVVIARRNKRQEEFLSLIAELPPGDFR